MISEIWNIIMSSNLFNFLIFAGLIFLILKKINLSGKISDMQKQAENRVINSTEEKRKSKSALKSAKRKLDNAPKEVEKIIDNAKNTAELLSKNIIKQADSQIEVIEKNAQNVYENDLRKTKKVLSSIAVNDAIKLSEANLISRLQNEPNLHQKFINEAISELEGMDL